MKSDILKEHGIGYEKGVARYFNDEEFYLQILTMFLQDTSFKRAQASYVARDYKSLFEHLHELKGVCGNTELTALYEAVSPMVELLRSGVRESSVLEAHFSAIKEAYIRVCDGIRLASAE